MTTSVWALRGVVQELMVERGLSLDEAMTQTIEKNVPRNEWHEASEALRALLMKEAREEEDPSDRLVLEIPDRTQLSLGL